MANKRMKGGQGMNPIYIVLGIIVFVVIAYYVYSYWFSGVNTLSSGMVNLNTKTAPPPILANTLTNANATRYSYGIWVFVNTWDTSKPKVIFSRYNDVVLYLDNTAAVLKCYISPTFNTKPGTDAIYDVTNTTAMPTAQIPITITNNFPIQKWMYISIIIDNKIVDFYLNGKMVKSLNMNQVSPDSTSSIFYGNGFDATVNGFQRWATVLDPQSVYNYYLNGSSSVSSSSMTNGYHTSIVISKDGEPNKDYKMF